jgi:uncharacterized RDD family membrane protein YckC
MAHHVETTSAKPAYGRFSRRLKAFVIDWIIIILLLVIALFGAVSANSDRVGRVLGFTFVGVWLLYEPLLVWLTGSTVGHYISNLRVVDDRTHGNVSFLKAVARLVIKSVLGIYSFVTMATTSRHQAVHDMLTRSTVQIRDRSKARHFEYVVENTGLLSPTIPSRLRRLVAILCYSLATFVFYSILIGVLTSNVCTSSGTCSPTENAIIEFGGLIWLGASALFIIQGWRGRLYGCRAASQN